MRRRTLLELAVLAIGAPRGAFAAATRGTRLVLLGTQGGPNYLPTRAETASALVVDGHTYLFDCGYGTLAALIKAGLSYRAIDHVFLTHLHDDHSADVAALIGHQWTDGRVAPVVIYGPSGTERLVAAAIAYDALNEEIRLVDESRSVRLASYVSAREVPAGRDPVDVFHDERLAVTAVESAHYPAESKARMPHRALSYRCETPGRSVVFSGDTAPTPALVALAKGADVLVCEAMDLALTRRNFEARVAKGAYADNPEGIWHHIVRTHTTTEQAGEMAAAAGVKTLVLNHILPGALAPRVRDGVYSEAARKHFNGEIIVGRDLQVI